VLAFALAAVLAAATWRRPTRLSLRAGAWLLATFALWGALLRLPLFGACSLILAAGIGRLLAEAVAARGFGLRVGWVRTSLAGFLGIFVLSAAFTTARQALRESRALAGLPRAAAARNVVFIVWDTVRVSNVNPYGYARRTTPNLVDWAQRGVRFERPVAPSPWTYPSHTCFFTGQWPFRTNSQWKFVLDTPDATLAEFLSRQGYQTAGFVANTNNCSHETGLDRGFIHFEDYALTPLTFLSRTVPGKWMLERLLLLVAPYERKWVSLESRGAQGINEAFLTWLGKRRTDRPFFAFLNYFDAHDPYIPPAGYGQFGIRPTALHDYQTLFDYIGLRKIDLSRRDFRMVRDCYDNCIAFVDDALGRLLKELERRRILDDTVVIITSDHGEGFGEHQLYGHSYAVEIQEVGVPLVILAPGAPAGRSVPTAVSLRDIPATVADLLGLHERSPFPGRSLSAHWRVGSAPGPVQLTSPALSEKADSTVFGTPSREAPGGPGLEISLVAANGFQYIRTGKGVEGLYNLEIDPDAQLNLLGVPAGDMLVRQFRKLLLNAVTQDRGSLEAERAYLEAYRRKLHDAVRSDEARSVASGFSR
jgi:arylsulfatase A-like enzyme